jgi:hypothetical protein
MAKKVQSVANFDGRLRQYVLKLSSTGREIKKLSDLDFWELRQIIDLTDSYDMSLMIKQLNRILIELAKDKK